MRAFRRRGGWAGWLWSGGALILAGCATTPGGRAPVSPDGAVLATPGRDGAEAHPPTGLDRTPDAEPRIEAIRAGGPNKPYEVFGRDYVPMTQDRPYRERGLASWYGRKFHGRRTSSGEPYDMYAMTAAHPTLPIPSYVRVRNPATEREIVVRINDRGPFHAGRVIDLSYTAALKLGLLRGVGLVELTRITFAEIRDGTWRKGPAEAAPAPAPASPPDESVASADPAPGFWVQLGVFRQREGAEGFHRRIVADVDWLSPLLSVFSESSSHKLWAGPYASRDEAQGAARRVQESLSLVPVIVERR